MSKTLLLIDDEPNMTELAGTYLRLNGFEVEAANGPEAGLELLKTKAYDGIAVDLMMPGIKGLGIVDAIRALPGHAATPLFVISSKSLSAEERTHLVASNARLIPKPFSPKLLIEAIADGLAKAAKR